MESTPTKVCIKCGDPKELNEFYRHPQMADGHLNKCKECTKKENRANREARADYYNEYDRSRYHGDPNRRAASDAVARRMRTKYPERYAARNAVNNALREGRLIRQPCIVCGAPETEAHHEDYGKPLEVIWMCVKHHKQHHKRRTT